MSIRSTYRLVQRTKSGNTVPLRNIQNIFVYIKIEKNHICKAATPQTGVKNPKTFQKIKFLGKYIFTYNICDC